MNEWKPRQHETAQAMLCVAHSSHKALIIYVILNSANLARLAFWDRDVTTTSQQSHSMVGLQSSGQVSFFWLAAPMKSGYTCLIQTTEMWLNPLELILCRQSPHRVSNLNSYCTGVIWFLQSTTSCGDPSVCNKKLGPRMCFLRAATTLATGAQEQNNPFLLAYMYSTVMWNVSDYAKRACICGMPFCPAFFLMRGRLF